MEPPSQESTGYGNASVPVLLDRLFPRRNIQRVLLVNPPDADASLFRFDTAKRGRYANYPPYGLAVLAANLRAVEVEPRIVNLNHEVLAACQETDHEEGYDFDATWRAKLDAEIDAFSPDLICVTCMFTMTHDSLVAVCRHAARSGVPLAVGGVHVSNDPQRVLRDQLMVDAIFLREGDRAIRKFVAVVRQEAEPDELAQVVLVDRESEEPHREYHFHKSATPTSEEISLLPAYDLVDVTATSEVGTIGSFYFLRPRDTTYATVLSNRGCRASCTFCSVRNFNGASVRTRSVASVIEELKHLRFERGVDHIMWLDDDLCYDSKRAIELFDSMVRNRLDLTWDATNGILAASCKDELVAAAAESGCIALNIGMESGNPEILRQIRKPANVDVLLEAAEVLRRYEQIHASVFLMLGFPQETKAMIWDTLRVAREMDLDWYRISQLQPLPNTPIYDAMVAQGLLQSSDSSSVRFMAGGFGKQNELEQNQLAHADFQEAFASIAPDDIPTSEQLTDIWFYLNYHLNFARIFHERRPTKIDQLKLLLKNLSDLVAPEHAFALYFQGYLAQITEGCVDPQIVGRLQQRLGGSDYWNQRFRAFGLSIEDLIQNRAA